MCVLCRCVVCVGGVCGCLFFVIFHPLITTIIFPFPLSVRRGYLVYKEVCAACHSMQYIKFRNLVGVSHTEEEAKTIVEEVCVCVCVCVCGCVGGCILCVCVCVWVGG